VTFGIDTRRDQRLGVIERVLPEDHTNEDALLLVAQRHPGQRPPFGHLPFGAARKNTLGLIERAGMTDGRKRPRKIQSPVEHGDRIGHPAFPDGVALRSMPQ